MIKQKKYIFKFIFICFLFSASLCAATDKPTVFVSIVPQKFFVQQISKDKVNVEIMVQPGASPATYEPKPSQMAKLSISTAYFAIGVPFEKVWLGKIRAVNPKMEIVRTDKGIGKIAMTRHHHELMGREQHREEEDGRDNQAAHTILDPHIWLAPVLVKQQAAVILESLTALFPEYAGEFATNYRVFLEKVDALDIDLKSQFRDNQGMRFMVFHPSWGYFAREYGLQQIPIEIEGKAPKPAQLQELIHYARENDISVIFVQPQFSRKSAEVIASEIHGKVVFADPLAENWFVNLRNIAAKLKSVVK